MADLKDLVGKRILLRDTLSEETSVFEAKLEEVSPSGQYIKLGKTWADAGEFQIIEELAPEESAEEKPTEEERGEE